MVFCLIVEADPAGKSQLVETAPRKDEDLYPVALPDLQNGRYRIAVGLARITSATSPAQETAPLDNAGTRKVRALGRVDQDSGPASPFPHRPHGSIRTTPSATTHSPCSECSPLPLTMSENTRSIMAAWFREAHKPRAKKGVMIVSGSGFDPSRQGASSAGRLARPALPTSLKGRGIS